MSEYCIKKGSKVNVYWEHIEPELNLTILYTPACEGDSYLCERENGDLVQIMNYGKMELIK